MIESNISIYLDGEDISVGTLRCHEQLAEFDYDNSWRDTPYHTDLEPAFADVGVHAGNPLGALADSAPDHWGRLLINRYSGKIDANEEIDYLLAVNNEARLGALSFSQPEGYKAYEWPNPQLSHLSIIMPIVENVLQDEFDSSDILGYLHMLLAPGSSLGGARPKAVVRGKNRHLALAKFPSPKDYYLYDAIRWEAVALKIAEQAGINTPLFYLHEVNSKQVLIVERFDRSYSDDGQETRIPFLSAKSMIGAYDKSAKYSYLNIADCLQQYGRNPVDDLHELWRRMVLTVMISNTDDHLRNHGFLYHGAGGWNLSPVYDINPDPTGRNLNTAINEHDTSISLDNVMNVAELFRLDEQQADTIVTEVRGAVRRWREFAADYGISEPECERMAPAFKC